MGQLIYDSLLNKVFARSKEQYRAKADEKTTTNWLPAFLMWRFFDFIYLQHATILTLDSQILKFNRAKPDDPYGASVDSQMATVVRR